MDFTQNPFCEKQQWPLWTALHLASVDWCLILAQFHVQSMRRQSVVEYTLKDSLLRTSSDQDTPSQEQDPGLPSPQARRRGGTTAFTTSREKAMSDMQELLVSTQLQLERALAPSRRLEPEIQTTWAPDWRPLALPKAVDRPQTTGPSTQSARPSLPTPLPEPFPFLIFGHPHQVPAFLAASGMGLVLLRSFIAEPSSRGTWMKPLEDGLVSLNRPHIHCQGILPLQEPPSFPLAGFGPIVTAMNEAHETSKQRHANGVLWSLVDHHYHHPIETGL